MRPRPINKCFKDFKIRRIFRDPRFSRDCSLPKYGVMKSYVEDEVVAGKKLNVEDLAGKMLKLFYPIGKTLMITICVAD